MEVAPSEGDLYERVENALLRSAYRFCHYNQVHG